MAGFLTDGQYSTLMIENAAAFEVTPLANGFQRPPSSCKGKSRSVNLVGDRRCCPGSGKWLRLISISLVDGSSRGSAGAFLRHFNSALHLPYPSFGHGWSKEVANGNPPPLASL